MRALVIYDLTGKIWSILYNQDKVPQGLSCMWVDIPEGGVLERIDLSDPARPEPVFSCLPETDIGTLQKQMKQIQKENAVHALAASFAAEGFTDRQALQVPALYPQWSGEGITYKAGERTRYQDVLYKVLQSHTSQEAWTPDSSPSLFAKVLIPDEDNIPNWEQPESTNGYAAGDKVQHKGEIWESLTDGNVWEPGEIGTENQWKKAE